MTLPILNLLAASQNGQREELTQIILNGDADGLASLRARARDAGSMAAAAEAGVELIEEGVAQLEILPESPYRTALANVGQRLGAMIGQFAE